MLETAMNKHTLIRFWADIVLVLAAAAALIGIYAALAQIINPTN